MQVQDVRWFAYSTEPFGAYKKRVKQKQVTISLLVDLKKVKEQTEEMAKILQGRKKY